MKRWALRICVFLLLGAIVNVAVAWSVALCARPYSSGSHEVTSLFVPESVGAGTGREYRLDVYHTFGALWIKRQDMGLIPEDVFQRDLANRVRQGKAVAHVDLPAWMVKNVTSDRTGWNMRKREDVVGWPTLALACHYEGSWSNIRFNSSPAGTSGTSDAGELHDGIEVRGRILLWLPRDPLQRLSIALPLRPVWPGFAINTLFYAAILWLLFAGPFALRRRRRIRRGLCPKCAYDLRNRPSDSAACPECGAARANA